MQFRAFRGLQSSVKSSLRKHFRRIFIFLHLKLPRTPVGCHRTRQHAPRRAITFLCPSTMDASLFKPLALSLRNHLDNTLPLRTKKGHDSAREMLLPFVSLVRAFWETLFFFSAFPFGVEAAGYLHENTLKLCKEGSLHLLLNTH